MAKVKQEKPARFQLGFFGSVIALLIFILGIWKLIELIINYFK